VGTEAKWRHTPTRPQSADDRPSILCANPPHRGSFGLASELRAVTPKSTPQKVRQRRAVDAATIPRPLGIGGELRPILWQREAVQHPRLKPRQSPATFVINGGCFGNLRIGSSVRHLLIAPQVAEPKMPTNCASGDFLLIRLRPGRAPTISVLVTTRERVGRTIKSSL
jgi:hypothetical protein